MNTPNNPQLSTEPGRIVPQALELEDAVLGALLLESKAYVRIEDILASSDFYSPANQIIFSSVGRLYTKRQPVDMLTVVEELRTMGELENVGGILRIAGLTDKVASAAHIEYHARVIKQKSRARQLAWIAAQVQAKAFDETADIAETIEYFEKEFTGFIGNTSGIRSVQMPDAVTSALNHATKIQHMYEKGIDPAITTGLKTLDEEFAGGWRPPDLVILGARPSMGKTQHALGFAKAAAKKGNHVLFISIEMNTVQLINRYFLEDERISGYNLRSGQMDADEWNALDQTAGKLWNLPLHIADGPDIRYLHHIKSEARRLHRKGNLDMMIIDYLGLIRTTLKFERRQLEIAYITSELKNICKELEIPVLLLSQLSRPPKGVAIREPQLEDLRESGDIEQDADMVLFIHKPDYYDPDAIDSKGKPWKGRGKLIISKYREGARNHSVIFYHDERYKKITGMEGKGNGCGR